MNSVQIDTIIFCCFIRYTNDVRRYVCVTVYSTHVQQSRFLKNKNQIDLILNKIKQCDNLEISRLFLLTPVELYQLTPESSAFYYL
jgi:ferredoxin-like protein FixX